ncbi:exosortase B [Methylomonas paludis]|uniref:Exosortase B n=1 Tax=Methylomonas paludis TaxID=1173101 RepID=A0A975MMG1_9GAMM|nr:exosortase B [Methylomonas paludis]QWF70031.1 exosortase B [Methylomonas paludis]
MDITNIKNKLGNFKKVIAFWPVLIGLGVVIGSTLYDVNQSVWQTSQNAHGPIVLLICIWYFLFKISILIDGEDFKAVPSPVIGYIVLLFGLFLYIVSRSQDFYTFEVLSLVFILSGVTFIFLGGEIHKNLWFGFFFMLFMIPLPISIVDAITLPLKIAVSWAAQNLLYQFNYPIARNGVILSIGQYQLMVADACSGLNSLFTLEAMGLLYMNVKRYESVTRNILLGLMIMPISFVANVLRVTLLILITYYFGEMAGQGFLHEFSSMVLFLSALIFIMMVDGFLEQFQFIKKISS